MKTLEIVRDYAKGVIAVKDDYGGTFGKRLAKLSEGKWAIITSGTISKNINEFPKESYMDVMAYGYNGYLSNYIMFKPYGVLSPEMASIPVMLIDNEICGIVNRMKKGIDVSEGKIAYDIIKMAGIRGNYLNPVDDEVLEHSVKYYREENFIPKLSVRMRT